MRGMDLMPKKPLEPTTDVEDDATIDGEQAKKDDGTTHLGSLPATRYSLQMRLDNEIVKEGKEAALRVSADPNEFPQRPQNPITVSYMREGMAIKKSEFRDPNNYTLEELLNWDRTKTNILRDPVIVDDPNFMASDDPDFDYWRQATEGRSNEWPAKGPEMLDFYRIKSKERAEAEADAILRELEGSDAVELEPQDLGSRTDSKEHPNDIALLEKVLDAQRKYLQSTPIAAALQELLFGPGTEAPATEVEYSAAEGMITDVLRDAQAVGDKKVSWNLDPDEVREVLRKEQEKNQEILTAEAVEKGQKMGLTGVPDAAIRAARSVLKRRSLGTGKRASALADIVHHVQSHKKLHHVQHHAKEDHHEKKGHHERKLEHHEHIVERHEAERHEAEPEGDERPERHERHSVKWDPETGTMLERASLGDHHETLRESELGGSEGGRDSAHYGEREDAVFSAQDSGQVSAGKTRKKKEKPKSPKSQDLTLKAASGSSSRQSSKPRQSSKGKLPGNSSGAVVTWAEYLADGGSETTSSESGDDVPVKAQRVQSPLKVAKEKRRAKSPFAKPGLAELGVKLPIRKGNNNKPGSPKGSPRNKGNNNKPGSLSKGSPKGSPSRGNGLLQPPEMKTLKKKDYLALGRRLTSFHDNHKERTRIAAARVRRETEEADRRDPTRLVHKQQGTWVAAVHTDKANPSWDIIEAEQSAVPQHVHDFDMTICKQYGIPIRSDKWWSQDRPRTSHLYEFEFEDLAMHPQYLDRAHQHFESLTMASKIRQAEKVAKPDYQQSKPDHPEAHPLQKSGYADRHPPHRPSRAPHLREKVKAEEREWERNHAKAQMDNLQLLRSHANPHGTPEEIRSAQKKHPFTKMENRSISMSVLPNPTEPQLGGPQPGGGGGRATTVQGGSGSSDYHNRDFFAEVLREHRTSKK